MNREKTVDFSLRTRYSSYFRVGGGEIKAARSGQDYLMRKFVPLRYVTVKMYDAP